MTARTRHIAVPAAFAEGSTEAAYNVLCETQPKQGTTLWATTEVAEVTCKKCQALIPGALVYEETCPEAPAEPVFKTQAVSRESLYTSDAYLAPTGPFIESVHDIIIPTDFDDKSIAQRHGLERFEVENAVNDGWLVR